jgi:membrane-associated phospholipid phosphatase
MGVGFARIYVGAHFPLDIIGGILVALFAVLVWTLLWESKIGPWMEKKGWIPEKSSSRETQAAEAQAL